MNQIKEFLKEMGEHNVEFITVEKSNQFRQLERNVENAYLAYQELFQNMYQASKVAEEIFDERSDPQFDKVMAIAFDRVDDLDRPMRELRREVTGR